MGHDRTPSIAHHTSKPPIPATRREGKASGDEKEKYRLKEGESIGRGKEKASGDEKEFLRPIKINCIAGVCLTAPTSPLPGPEKS